MKCGAIILAVVVLGIALVSADRLLGQPLEDYRLSRDRFNYALPEDIRIQGAGEIGSARLVVWGTMVDDGSGVPVNGLVMNVNGMQRVLTSDEARPYGAVGVVPLSDRFLVVWNDRRSGEEGIWSRTVLTGGEFGGEEYLLSAGGKISGDVYWWSGPAHMMLFWTDMRTDTAATCMARLSADGNRIYKERNLGKGVINPLQTYNTDNGFLVIGRETASGYMVRPDGELDERLIPVGRLNGLYYIIGDTAAAVVTGATFYYYTSLFDSIPLWEFDVPLNPDFEHTSHLSKDSTGWFIGFHTSTSGVESRVNYVRLRFDSLGNYSKETDWDFLCGYVLPGNAEGIASSAGTKAAYRWPGNFYSIVVSHSASYGLYQDGSSDRYNYSGQCLYSVDSNGVRLPFKPLPISSLHPYFLRRTAFDTVSSIEVEWFGSSEKSIVSTPVYPKRFAADPIRANIVVRDNAICAGWIQKDGKLVFARYPSLFNESDLFTTGQLEIQTSPGLMWQRWDGGGYPAVSYSVEKRNLQYGGFVFIVASHMYFYELSSTGWKRREWGRGESYSLEKPMIPSFIESAYDPNHALHSLIRFYPEYAQDETFSPQPKFQFYTYDVDITATARWDSMEPVELGVFDTRMFEQYVPISDSSGIVLMTKDTAVICDSHGSGVIVPLATSGSLKFVLAQRLYGDRFLRILSDSSAQKFRLELYTTTGELLKVKEIPGNARHPYVFPLQRKSDSAVVLLWGGSKGVRGTLLSKNLEMVIDRSADALLADVQISATSDTTAYPAGIFRNDTLFVVWEDYRNGAESDIYGTWWPVPKSLHVVGEERSDTVATPPQIPVPGDPSAPGIRVVWVAPNPAQGEIGLRVASGEQGSGRVELYDGLGRRVLAREIALVKGLGIYRLDVSNVPSGSYFLQIASGTSVAEERLIIWGP